MVVTESDVITASTYQVKVIDTIGAGNAFNAAFLYSVAVKKWDHKNFHVCKCSGSPLKCTKLGTRTSLLKLEEINGLLKNGGVTF